MTKKMACTFYQNALRSSRANDLIKITRNYGEINLLTYAWPSKGIPLLFLNDFQPQRILIKCTPAIFFVMVNLHKISGIVDVNRN